MELFRWNISIYYIIAYTSVLCLNKLVSYRKILFFNRISFNFLRNQIVHFTRNSNSTHVLITRDLFFYILYLNEVSAKRVNLTRSLFHRFLMIFSSRCVNRLRSTLSKPTAFFMIYAWYNIHKDGKIVTGKKNMLHWKCTVKRELSTFYVFRDFYKIL